MNQKSFEAQARDFNSGLTTLLFEFANDPAVYVFIHDGIVTFGKYGGIDGQPRVSVPDTVSPETVLERRASLREARRILHEATTPEHFDFDEM